MALRPATAFRDQALGILAMHRRQLSGLGIAGTLVLVGGSSVAAALTKGDVDLHLRVPPADFPPAVAILRVHLAVRREEIWSPTLATYEVPATLQTGLAVTPIGSVHDLRFNRCWQLLAADPALVAEYNAMKLAGDGPDGATYEARKSAFFDRLLQLWPTHPAGGRSARPVVEGSAPPPW